MEDRIIIDTCQMNEISEIPTVELDDLLGRRWIEMEYSDGQLLDHEAVALLDIVRDRKPWVVLEIGTYMGHTTRRLAETVGRWSGTVVTVDLPPSGWSWAGKSNHEIIDRRDVGREFRGLPCAGWIVQVLCDTWEWDWKEGCGAEVVYIDGSHTYEYVRNDSEKALEVVAGDAMIIWHDADENHPGILRLLGEWRAAGRDIRKIKGTRLAYYVLV